MLIDEMLDPALFPHPVTYLEVRETHVSWIILTGYYAYKIKKPVRLDFIDATALETRRTLCMAEVALNRRLASELYLGMVVIARSRQGLRITHGSDQGGDHGDIVEYAVKMRQFPAADELHNLLAGGAVSRNELERLAGDLAAFHGRAPRAATRLDAGFSASRNLRKAVLGTLASLLSHQSGSAALPELARLVDWTHDELHRLRPVLQRREDDERVRECHGDLHARNIVRWQGRLIPFDCLEFAADLRWIDVMSDVAFLVMDLVSHARVDLAQAFLSGYLEHTGDYHGLTVLPLYAAYRAAVRAMVDALDGEDGLMLQRIATAVRFMQRPAPSMILMHGPSGAGKSWLSERLAPEFDAIRIRSDVERRRVAAVCDLTAAPGSGAGPGRPRGARYDPEALEATYRRLLDCTASALEGRFTAIVDATFLSPAERQRFISMAEARRIRWVIVECWAPRETLVSRIEARRRAGADPSEADIEVLERQLRQSPALSSEERRHSLSIDMQGRDPAQSAITALRHYLAEYPAAPPPH